MTDLDDALNTSAPTIIPPYLTAFWKEVPDGITNTGNADAVAYLDEQMTGEYTVRHSLDDGMPDPVTMTTTNDASGKLEVPLNGKAGMTASEIGWRGAQTQTGTGTSGTIPFPSSGVYWGDYVIVALSVNSQSAIITQAVTDPEDHQNWKLLRTVQDGAVNTLYIYGRPYWDGLFAFSFTSSASVTYSGISAGAYARSANWNSWIDYVPAHVNSSPEANNVTSHTSPVALLRRRGFVVSVWSEQGTTGGAMTYTGPGNELAEITTGQGLMVATTPVTPPGNYTVTANTAVATNILMMATIALEIADRPTMDARAYFSPFNKNSPVYGFDRDTAFLYLTNNFLGPNGAVATTIFSGQMQDIELKDRQAELTALSKTRLDLDRSLILPTVSGARENASIDWLATWVMARGGQYAGPAPSAYTRYWGPMYGSLHGHFDSPFTYNAGFFWQSEFPNILQGQRYPKVVEGPFMTGMYAQQTATRTEEIQLNMYRLDQARSDGLPLPYSDEKWQFNDQFSKASSAGRVSFWIRGDAAVAAPSYVPSDRHDLAQYNLFCQDAAGVFLGYVMVTLSAADRQVRVRMGADATGSTIIVYNVAGQVLPTDGEWHFVGIKWNFATGQVEVRMDGVTSGSNAYATNGDNDTSVLPDTDNAGLAAGFNYTNLAKFHLPVSDFCLESGLPAYNDNWSRNYPIPVGSNAVMRPTNHPLIAIAEPNPMQGWNVLVELARATMSAYRTNEGDSFEFLPPEYFGESAQMTPSMVADTEVNAGELNVISDPSKTRNVVTVSFEEKGIDFFIVDLMAYGSVIELPRGETVIEFPSDKPIAEVHKFGNALSGTNWTLTNLNDNYLVNGAGIPINMHYLTANTAEDGSGTILPRQSVEGKILGFTAGSVTISFVNKTSRSVYLSNGAEQIPVVRIVGYGVNSRIGYETARDSGSISKRRERPLDVEVPWIHHRDVAMRLAQLMASALARPREQVSLEVMADPRRKPGDLIQIADAQGTQADGLWRVWSVEHIANGAQYTQRLDVSRAYPPGVWDDQDNGWDHAVWVE